MSDATLLLANMGGPRSADEVEPYLRAIFADPAILPVPGMLRGPLGRWIARRRAPKVADRYQLIGGGSPLGKWTERQVERTRAALAAEGREVRVVHGFRYTAPTVEQVMAEQARGGAKRVLLLPLFPHHTDAMTGSIVRVARAAASASGLELRTIDAWGARAEVLAVWRRMLATAIEEAGPGARVLFVAHGIPMRSVRRGEDYPHRVADTARELAASLPVGTSWSLAYQSRVGPIRWTEPYLDDELRRYAVSRAPLVLMPLSFVADCLETLYDLDVVASQRASRAGVQQVVRVPAFNDDPDFARALAHMAGEQLDRWAGGAVELAAARPPTDHDAPGDQQ